MSRLGEGTPLPTMMARKLVVKGPYRALRNPMALAGIMQGVFVGVLFGSWPTIAYSVSGAVIWHVFVRPVEEHDLEERFGDEYRAYKSRAGVWLPFLFRAR